MELQRTNIQYKSICKKETASPLYRNYCGGANTMTQNENYLSGSLDVSRREQRIHLYIVIDLLYKKAYKLLDAYTYV